MSGSGRWTWLRARIARAFFRAAATVRLLSFFGGNRAFRRVLSGLMLSETLNAALSPSVFGHDEGAAALIALATSSQVLSGAARDKAFSSTTASSTSATSCHIKQNMILNRPAAISGWATRPNPRCEGPRHGK